MIPERIETVVASLVILSIQKFPIFSLDSPTCYPSRSTSLQMEFGFGSPQFRINEDVPISLFNVIGCGCLHAPIRGPFYRWGVRRDDAHDEGNSSLL